jgi:hypothetical protein
MALREFTDAAGNLWTVWSTQPDWRSGLPTELHDGWLTFECKTTRKRLVPIPRYWEDASVERLRLYCNAAELTAGPRRSLETATQPGE